MNDTVLFFWVGVGITAYVVVLIAEAAYKLWRILK